MFLLAKVFVLLSGWDEMTTVSTLGSVTSSSLSSIIISSSDWLRLISMSLISRVESNSSSRAVEECTIGHSFLQTIKNVYFYIKAFV